MEKVPIAIWGCGNIGQMFYEEYKERYEVVCFFDNTPKSDFYDNIPIIIYNKKIKERYPSLMVVIASDIYLGEIEDQLKEEGLRRGRDYIPYIYIYMPIICYYTMRQECKNEEDVEYFLVWMKKTKNLAIFFGNCQIYMLRRLFSHSREFTNRYFIVTIPEVYSYQTEELNILKNMRAWKHCDLFVSQRIRKDNRFSPELATENIEQYISEKAMYVWIPNIYFKGYFPQAIRNAYNIDTGKNMSGKFPIGDRFVEEMINKDMSLVEILREISREDFLEERYIVEKIEESFFLLKEREKQCTICISDYILAHYKEKQLFYSENHPCNEVLIELTQRILEYLGLSRELIDVPEESLAFTLRGQDAPVYPAIRKFLGITEEDYWANRYYWDFHADFIKFYKKYMEECFGIGDI